MKIKDTFFMVSGEQYSLLPSTSFKKELVRSLSLDLKTTFGVGLDLKKIIGRFGHANYQFLGVSIEYFDLVPQSKPGLSRAKGFSITYLPHFSFDTILYIKNKKSDEFILDPTREFSLNSFEAYLRFEKSSISSFNELISRDLKSKNIRLFSEYKFPVKIYGLQLTCEIKVQFLEQFTVDDKKRIVNNVLGDIESFNKKNESLKEGHYGLIHNVIEIKSQNRKGSSLSFIVDLGSSGELGLKCILESLNSLDVAVDFVEVK